jgi:hypothetical protein
LTVLRMSIAGPTLNGVTAANIFFQSNQRNDVVG